MKGRPVEKAMTKTVQGLSQVTGGRGGKKEVPRRIDEFHLRGAAGRREVRGARGPRKAAMSHRGNRTKNPK